MREKQIINELVKYVKEHKIGVLDISIYDGNVYFVGRTNGQRVVSIEEKIND